MQCDLFCIMKLPFDILSRPNVRLMECCPVMLYCVLWRNSLLKCSYD